jgi:hypothetical protein
MVVDDLNAVKNETELQWAEKNALRATLFHHPQLQVVELDWSSGLILATMCHVEAFG